MSIYFDKCCSLQAIRRGFVIVGCISSVLSRETNMCPTSGWLNIIKSIAEVRFHYSLPLNLVTELQTLKRRKLNSIYHILRTNSPLKHLTEGKIEGLRRRGRRRKHLLDYFKEKRTYCNLKEEAPDRAIRRT